MNKNIAALLLAVITAFGAPAVVDEVLDDTPAPAIILDAPDTCEVGELVRLTYAARKVEWMLPGVDYEINEQRAWISFRQPGTYQVIVSGLVDSDVRLVSHYITVTGDHSVVIVTPGINDKAPQPLPDTPSFQLAAKVAQWCQEAGTPPEVASALGDNFIAAASSTSSTSELMKAIAAKNKETNQDGAREVLVKIQVWMIENLSGEDFDTHQCAMSEIGDGFLAHANK